MNRFFMIGLLLFVSLLSSVQAAEYRTQHFIVSDAYAAEDAADDAREPSREELRSIAQEAERLRRVLALQWFGRIPVQAASLCVVSVEITGSSCKGGTSYRFESGQPSDWRMELSGSMDAILNDVLPHEVMHILLASHLSRIPPRWLDEGIASNVETYTSRQTLRKRCWESLGGRRWIPLSRLLLLKEYPRDKPDQLQFYYQSTSLTEYLLLRGQGRGANRCRFLDPRRGERLLLCFERKFYRYGADTAAWNRAVREVYGFLTVDDLERCLKRWLECTHQGIWV